MMPDKITIGVLGCADIAIRSMIPAILESDHLYRLTGVASRSRDKAEACASRFGVRAYASYDELLNSKNLDALYIPLPNALHAPWIEKALNRNLHILAEKPLTTSLDETARLTHQAANQGLTLLENFQFRFHQQIAEIQNRLQDGVIGDIRCMRSSFGFPMRPDAQDIRYNKALGGGALLDAGVYPIKATQMFLGHDVDIQAASLFRDPANGIDLWGGGFLRQKRGPLFSEIAFGFGQFYQCNVEFWGTYGKLSASRIFTAPPGLDPEIIIETTGRTDIIRLPADNHFKKMLSYFYHTVYDRPTSAAEHAENIHQARLVNEFREIADAA